MKSNGKLGAGCRFAGNLLSRVIEVWGRSTLKPPGWERGLPVGVTDASADAGESMALLKKRRDEENRGFRIS